MPPGKRKNEREPPECKRRKASIAADPPGPFQFLALPPEIRNLIYEYYLPSSLRLKRKKSIRIDHKTNSLKTNSLNLAQVCRQVREEFHPLLVLHLSVIGPVTLSDSELAFEDFLPASRVLELPTTLIIDIYRRRNTKPVNILPLILAMGRENLQIQFQCTTTSRDEIVRVAQNLNRMFSEEQARWVALAKSNVSGIYLNPSNGLNVIFKDRGFEKWVKWSGIAKTDFGNDLGYKRENHISLWVLSDRRYGGRMFERTWWG